MSYIATSLRPAVLRIRPTRFINQSYRFNSTIKQASTLKEFQELIKTEKLTITDFYATWCGPCKAIAPVLEKFSKEYEDVQFLKVDVDESNDIAQEYGITAMPTFVLYKGTNGDPIGKIVGANPQVIKQALEQYK